MYKVLDKDTIKNEIAPHLSKEKRGFECKSDITEVINVILYKLKSGCQWGMLPVGALFSDIVLSWQSVYHHFCKWSKNGDWKQCWVLFLSINKSELIVSLGLTAMVIFFKIAEV